MFIPLHVHSEYSIVDSILTVGDIVDYAHKEGMHSIALTDRNNIYGLIKFYKKARSKGIKPILGCDMTIRDDETGQMSQLLLLAQDVQGFHRLCEIISYAYEYDQSDKEGIAVLKSRLNSAQCQGIIALSAGLDGDVGLALLDGNPQEAHRRAKHWQDIFADRYYLQITALGRAGEEDYRRFAYEIGKTLGIVSVAANPACFKTAADFATHEVRVCISNKWTLEDPRRPKIYNEAYHLYGQEEMNALFKDAPTLLTNSETIAKRCNVVLDLGHNYLPDFPIPNEFSKIEDYLTSVAKEGLEARLLQRYPDEKARDEARPRYEERLTIELGVINQMGFAGYFLIVADFIQWAKDNDVPVGPGRGSGAGSLVAYAIKITDLDPLAYDLLFERFLNPERISMPDFDVDFCMEKRERVIQYVANKYGLDRVSQIATHGTMAAKGVIRDVGRVLGMPYVVSDRTSKLVPNVLGVTLKDALGWSDKSKEKPEFFSPDLLQEYQSNEELKNLIDIGLQLEGLARSVGKHAGGVVIAPTKLTDFSAIYCESAGAGLVTQFDKDDIEAVGLVKFDFLGLRTLTVIDWALKNVNLSRAKQNLAPLKIESIDLADEKAFALLKSGQTSAVFQLESTGMKGLIKKLQPDTFEDIVALVALYRPGPLQSGMVDDFINRKHGLAEVEYPHPALEPILKNTYGVMVYQEQVMQVAQVLANYSLGEADILRRAMGKKKAEEMAKQKAIFVSRALENGVADKTANAIFDLMAKFAEYGFNKSHSAAYALLSYQTLWLKTYYPAEFMAAVLSSDIDKPDKLMPMIAEAQDMGIRIIPPALNTSQYMFSTNEQGEILFGLGAIKGVGEAAISQIIEEREKNGDFLSFSDFCRRLDLKKLNRATMETLICAGVFDALEPNRGGLFASLEQAIALAERHHKNLAQKQLSMFSLLDNNSQSDFALNIKTEDAWDKNTLLKHEKQALGLFLSDHPIADIAQDLSLMCPYNLFDFAQLLEEWKAPEYHGKNHKTKPIRFAGLITSLEKKMTRRGQAMMIVTMEDRAGRIEFILFEDQINDNQQSLKLDEVVIAEGVAEYSFYHQAWRTKVEKILPYEQAKWSLAKGITLNIRSEHVASLLPILTEARHPDECAEKTSALKLWLDLSCRDIAMKGQIFMDSTYAMNAEVLKKLQEAIPELTYQMRY